MRKILVSMVVVISILFAMASVAFAQPQAKFVTTYQVQYKSITPGYYSSNIINWDTKVKVGNKYFNLGDTKTLMNNNVYITVKGIGGIAKTRVHKKYYNTYYGAYNGQLHQGNNYITVKVKKNNSGAAVKWKFKIYCKKVIIKQIHKPTFKPTHKTDKPTFKPTYKPTYKPTEAPTIKPTEIPTVSAVSTEAE